MKLSEAIRLGAMASPQANGEFYLAGATCAQGAALLAIGRLQKHNQTVNHELMAEAWPWAQVRYVQCPECGYDGNAAQIIPHLNNTPLGLFNDDNHGWTRERIADWVATIEPAEPSPEQQQPAPETLLGAFVDFTRAAYDLPESKK